MITEIVSGSEGRARMIETFRAGQIAAVPTETVYGLAGAAFDAMAVARIFEAKQRPAFDPLIVHVPGIEWLWQIARRSDLANATLAEVLAEHFWPGPLTIVLPARDCVPSIVRAGLSTVAIRQSVHPDFQAIVEGFGAPLAAPSANRFGRLSPTSAVDVMKELEGKIPLVYDGGRSRHGVESTIVRPEEGGVEILRPGPIVRERLQQVCPILERPTGKEGRFPQVPGQLASHYAPATPLVLLAPNPGAGEAVRAAGGRRAALLVYDAAQVWQGAAAVFEQIRWLTGSHDPVEAAANLFGVLRELDESGVKIVVAFPPPERGVGVAILDRLRRAAATAER